MGKLNPEQLKQRRRKIFLKEITPEWVKYETKVYAINDEFEENTKNLHSQSDFPKYVEAIVKARADMEALKCPNTWMWLPGKEPQIGNNWDRTKHPPNQEVKKP